MNTFYVIEDDVTKNVDCIYVKGFINKELFLIYTYSGLQRLREERNQELSITGTEYVEYLWIQQDENGKLKKISDKEEVGSFGVTAIYW